MVGCHGWRRDSILWRWPLVVTKRFGGIVVEFNFPQLWMGLGAILRLVRNESSHWLAVAANNESLAFLFYLRQQAQKLNSGFSKIDGFHGGKSCVANPIAPFRSTNVGTPLSISSWFRQKNSYSPIHEFLPT